MKIGYMFQPVDHAQQFQIKAADVVPARQAALGPHVIPPYRGENIPYAVRYPIPIQGFARRVRRGHGGNGVDQAVVFPPAFSISTLRS